MTMLHKKGSQNDPETYRGIALINSCAKLFTLVLLERMTVHCENNNILPERQAGFRRLRSCTDNIFILNSIIQIHLRLKVFVAFVDFKSAFDTINHNLLW